MARRITQIYDRHLEPSGLTVTQFGVLAHIDGRDDVSIGALAERLVSDPTTLTRNLRPLERKGYVKLVPGREDKRRKVLVATARGQAALRDARPLWRKAQAEVAEALGEAGLATLHHSLNRSLERLAP